RPGRVRRRRCAPRPDLVDGPHRGRVRPLRRAPRTRLPRWPDRHRTEILHQLARADLGTRIEPDRVLYLDRTLRRRVHHRHHEPRFDHVEDRTEMGRLGGAAQAFEERLPESEGAADLEHLFLHEVDVRRKARRLRRRWRTRHLAAPTVTTTAGTIALSGRRDNLVDVATTSLPVDVATGRPNEVISQDVIHASTGKAPPASAAPSTSDRSTGARRSVRCTSAVANRRLGPTSS